MIKNYRIHSRQKKCLTTHARESNVYDCLILTEVLIVKMKEDIPRVDINKRKIKELGEKAISFNLYFRSETVLILKYFYYLFLTIQENFGKYLVQQLRIN